MNKIILLSAFLAMGSALTSCHVDKSEPVDVMRLDLALRDTHIPSDSSLLGAAQSWFAIAGIGEITDSTLEVYNRKPSTVSFYPGIDSVWTSASVASFAGELGSAYSRLHSEMPSMLLPRPVTVVSPFNQSVILADSLMFIGLNHYLGSDYKFYDYFPEWQRREKSRERLVPNIVEAIIRSGHPDRGDGTLLERMLYEGSVIELMVRTCGRDALPWDADQLAFLKGNEGRIWEKMLRDKLLYSSDESVARSLLSPGAVSAVIAPEVPGRAGAYIGWQIVRHRLSERKVGAEEMFSDEWLTDGNALSEARYQP